MLDEIDQKIIRVLEKDARTSLRKISKRVDVSLGTVSNRVKKMEKNGVTVGGLVLPVDDLTDTETNYIQQRIKEASVLDLLD